MAPSPCSLNGHMSTPHSDLRDAIDRLQQQWHVERPDVDVSSVGVLSRIWRVARALTHIRDAQLEAHGTDAVTIDVLAELRRAGPPYQLTAGELREISKISSGGVSQRLDRLERAGLIERRTSDGDRRVVDVRLTDGGRQMIDSVLSDLMAHDSGLLVGLTRAERSDLERLLRRLLVIVEQAEKAEVGNRLDDSHNDANGQPSH